MVTIGASVFCLTFALVEANSRGWGSTLIVSLFAASALLAGAFALTQRYGRFPMLTRRSVRNTQFVGACAAFLLFAIGMMGTLFLTVIALVNLWGYSELEAALAISPIPIVGLLVAPIVGRLSSRDPTPFPRHPGIAFDVRGSRAHEHLPAEPDYLAVLPALILIGAGVGATAPQCRSAPWARSKARSSGSAPAS